MSTVEKTPAESEPGVAPWYPPPTHPPPALARGASDGRALAALVTASIGLLLALPLGVPGLVLGPVAYFLGKSAVARIDASQDAVGNRSRAVTAWVLGVVVTAVGAVVSLVWLTLILLAISSPTG